MAVVFGILMFSFLIFIHELGHFSAAKVFGVQVNEFALFMGPAIFKKKVGETEYSLRCLPIGGYCAMEGEDGASENPRAFTNAKWWKRLIILVAGAFMNFLVGLILMTVLFLPVKRYITPVIESYEQGSTIVREDGLHVGDEIYKVDGERIYLQSDFSTIMYLNQDTYHDIIVIRNGQKVSLPNFNMEKHTFTNEDGSTSERYGISFGVADTDFGTKCKLVWYNTLDAVRMIRFSFRMLFNGQAGVKDVSGPVGIVNMMVTVSDESETVSDKLSNLTYFCAFIAINLAIMNMLPIPALDGGRTFGLLAVTAIEAITKKKVNPKIEGYIHGAGMILLLAMTGLIMLKDIIYLFI